jgi:sugar-specific transcriptional regulator TrmB
MNWKKKKGEWRAQNGENQYIIAKTDDPQLPPYTFKVKRPIVNTTWEHFPASSIEEAKAICEKFDKSYCAISTAEKSVQQRRKERLDAIFNDETKELIKVYRAFKKLSPQGKEQVRQQAPTVYLKCCELEDAGLDLEHVVYPK